GFPVHQIEAPDILKPIALQIARKGAKQFQAFLASPHAGLITEQAGDNPGCPAAGAVADRSLVEHDYLAEMLASQMIGHTHPHGPRSENDRFPHPASLTCIQSILKESWT